MNSLEMRRTAAIQGAKSASESPASIDIRTMIDAGHERFAQRPLVPFESIAVVDHQGNPTRTIHAGPVIGATEYRLPGTGSRCPLVEQQSAQKIAPVGDMPDMCVGQHVVDRGITRSDRIARAKMATGAYRDFLIFFTDPAFGILRQEIVVHHDDGDFGRGNSHLPEEDR